MILVTARNNAQECESVFMHRPCMEGPVDGFYTDSLIKCLSDAPEASEARRGNGMADLLEANDERRREMGGW